MPEPANLVHETSTTTGTGNFTLVNVNGKNSFSNAFGTGGSNVFDYFISNQGAAEWERGTGHMSDATTLVRDTVLESTNSDAAVNFSAGTKDITNDVPALNQRWHYATPVTASGTSETFSSLPSGLEEVEIFFDEVSLNSNDSILVTIGDSGGEETTGYVSYASHNDPSTTTTSSTSGYVIFIETSPVVMTGIARLCRWSPTSNIWVFEHTLGFNNGSLTGGGIKTLSGELDRVIIKSAGGSATYDSGDIQVRYR